MVSLLTVASMWAGEAASQDLFVRPDPGRTPVLLVPGWGDEASEVIPLRDRLAEAGWPAGSVSTLTFTDPFGSNEEHAPEIARAVDLLRRLTGRDRIDIIAHSMGGLAVRKFLDEAEEDPGVRRVVFLGTPHRGTVAAMLAWGEGGREMVPGSDFLKELNEPTGVGDQVEMLSIRSPLDLVVIPNSSAELSEARNLEVCCPTHQGLLEDPQAFVQIEGFLLHGPEGLSESVDPLLWEQIRALILAELER